MAQIVPGPRGIAESLGAGIGSGLQQLAEMKLKEMAQLKQQQRYSQGITPLFEKAGLSTDQAGQLGTLLASLGEKERTAAFQNISPFISLFRGTPAQTSQNGMQTNQKIEDIFKSPQQKIQEETLQLKREKAEREKDAQGRAEFQNVKPILEAQHQDYKSAKRLHKLATDMKKILLEVGEENWPTLLGQGPSFLIRDPKIRKYIAQSSTLMTLLAQSRKGQPSNYKTRLEGLGKASVDQPYQTQIELLDDVINDSNDVFQIQKDILNLKENNKGEYPRDLGQRLVELQEQRRGYPDGTVIEDDEGNYKIIINGQEQNIEPDDPRLAQLVGA